MLLLANAPFNGEDRGAQAAATLTGRVELIGEDLEARGVQHIIVPLTVTIPRRISIEDRNGFLAGLARWNAGTLGDVPFYVDQLLQIFESKEAQNIARPLLVAILEAIRDERDPQFDWDEDPNKKLDQIDGVFTLCDYLSLQEFQKQHLEPFYEKFPGIAISDTPDTVFSLQGIELELAPNLDRFRALKSLSIQGAVSQNFLDSLPPTLCRLSLPLFHMAGRILTRKETALAAVAENGWALQHASAGLRGDKEVVMGAVAQDGWALRYASAPLRGDREVVMVAVVRNGLALFFASDELRGNKEVVMAAVAQDALALRYASAELRADEEVVMAARAATNNPYTG
jgi:hypothetical protein